MNKQISVGLGCKFKPNELNLAVEYIANNRVNNESWTVKLITGGFLEVNNDFPLLIDSNTNIVGEEDVTLVALNDNQDLFQLRGNNITLNNFKIKAPIGLNKVGINVVTNAEKNIIVRDISFLSGNICIKIDNGVSTVQGYKGVEIKDCYFSSTDIERGILINSGNVDIKNNTFFCNDYEISVVKNSLIEPDVILSDNNTFFGEKNILVDDANLNFEILRFANGSEKGISSINGANVIGNIINANNNTVLDTLTLGTINFNSLQGNPIMNGDVNVENGGDVFVDAFNNPI